MFEDTFGIVLRLTQVSFVLLGVVLLSGCSSDPDGSAGVAAKAFNDSNLKRLRSMYATYYGLHDRPPKSEEELREVMASPAGEKHLRRIGVAPEDYDTTLTSERDGQPFLVYYGVPCLFAESQHCPLAVEAVGSSGVRYAIYTSSVVKELVDDTEFEEFKREAEKCLKMKVKVADQAVNGEE